MYHTANELLGVQQPHRKMRQTKSLSRKQPDKKGRRNDMKCMIRTNCVFVLYRIVGRPLSEASYSNNDREIKQEPLLYDVVRFSRYCKMHLSTSLKNSSVWYKIIQNLGFDPEPTKQQLQHYHVAFLSIIRSSKYKTLRFGLVQN